MITFGLISDLHLDFMPWEERLNTLDILANQSGDVDYLLVAGDTIEARTTNKVVKTIAEFSKRFKFVIKVAGNHEYYHSMSHLVTKRFRAAEKEFSNFRFLDCESFLLPNGNKVLGGTMWFSYPTKEAASMYSSGEPIKNRMNDFCKIPKFEPWVYQTNQKFQNFVREQCQKNDIVLTHHAPTPQQIEGRYINNPLNVFYHCDMTNVIIAKNPSFWCHGHMHMTKTTRMGDPTTHVIANAHGYPFENIWATYKVLKFEV